MFSDGSHHVGEKKNIDHPVICTVMYRKFCRWTGLRKSSELEVAEARHVSMFELCSRAFPIVIFQLFWLQMCMTIEEQGERHTH